MAAATKEARRKVIEAREDLGLRLDDLSAAARSAADIPSKIKKNPLQTAALAAGAGFLAVGGPKRAIKGAIGRIRPSTRRPHEGLLPKDIDKAVKKRGGDRAPEIQTALENDFADYLKEKGRAQKDQPSPMNSFLKTYDTIVGPLGVLAAKELSERLFGAQSGRKRGGPGDAPLTAETDATEGGRQAKKEGWRARERRERGEQKNRS